MNSTYQRQPGDPLPTGYFANIIADSINASNGCKLTTFHVRVPWYITPELLRHRCFSFSSASTRAIPTVKFLEQIEKKTFASPFHWGKNQKGMQSGDELSPEVIQVLKNQWEFAAICARDSVKDMQHYGLHKQITNKLLMPFLWCDILISGTTFANFYALRYHEDAAPEMQKIAELMLEEHIASEPCERATNKDYYLASWHRPLITLDDMEVICADLPEILRTSQKANNLHRVNEGFDWAFNYVSAARCARISMVRHDTGQTDILKDLELAYDLCHSKPVHASPFEHVAMADIVAQGSNFEGWKQFRKFIPNDTVTEFIYKGKSIR